MSGIQSEQDVALEKYKEKYLPTFWGFLKNVTIITVVSFALGWVLFQFEIAPPELKAELIDLWRFGFGVTLGIILAIVGYLIYGVVLFLGLIKYVVKVRKHEAEMHKDALERLGRK